MSEHSYVSFKELESPRTEKEGVLGKIISKVKSKFLDIPQDELSRNSTSSEYDINSIFSNVNTENLYENSIDTPIIEESPSTSKTKPLSHANEGNYFYNLRNSY